MWPLIKILIVTTIVQYVKLEDTSSSLENVETLPQPSALASPERSSLDEEQYNVSSNLTARVSTVTSPFSQMASSWLKHQFSLPHHLVPSYQDMVNNAPTQSQDFEVNLANHRSLHETGSYEYVGYYLHH